MICSNASSTLRLNESVTGGKYILQGVFAELDKLNRNQRIYTKEEYLKHLQYLREDIKKGEPLLGELDHPDDRFEVKLKEASHRILDLWYDQEQNVVMGKIELLDTPNGETAKRMVDQGIPLHISSRAAGTVNRDNTVSIQQIYTYDLVCKPGFANAILHRVNESAGPKYDNTTIDFLKKVESNEFSNIAEKYGLITESVSIHEVNSNVQLRKEALNLKENKTDNMAQDIMNRMAKLYEEDEDTNFDDLFEGSSDDSEKEDTDKNDGEKKDNSEGEKKDGIEIVDVYGELSDGSTTKDEDNSDSDENTEETSDENKDDEESKDEDEKNEEDDANSKEGNTQLFDKKKETTTAEKSVIDKLNDIYKGIMSKESASENTNECGENCNDSSCCESIILAHYPISMCLNEAEFAKFAALDEGQKQKVVAYLADKGISKPTMINEMWENGINYDGEPIWLKRASNEYRTLFANAPKSVQESLRATAEYLVFESQYDINSFWENSGLMEMANAQRINAKFVKNLPQINESVDNGVLPYGQDMINLILEMASEYN